MGITAFREGKFLLDAWESIVNQSSNEWEAIMILDGDNDRVTKNIFDR